MFMDLKKILFFLITLIGFVSPLMAQIESGQAVQITISGVPVEEKSRIDGAYPVSEDGFINMSFIGRVKAAGLRNEGLALSLQARYREAGIYTNATIQVISNSGNTINEQKVVVGGQVRAPGPRPFTKGLTLWQAVQAAGGPTEFGSMRRVTLFRDGKQLVYDLSSGKFMDTAVQPNDAINVPEKNMFGQ